MLASIKFRNNSSTRLASWVCKSSHAKASLDPHQHQAIEMVETEEVPDGYVFDELQHGLQKKSRLLRPAMVA